MLALCACVHEATGRPGYLGGQHANFYAFAALKADGSITSWGGNSDGSAFDGDYGAPSVSPDGTRVAFLGVVDTRLIPQNGRVGVVDVTAERASADSIVWPSDGLDRTFTTIAGAQPPVWIDDATILATAENRGEQHLYRLAADGSVGA